MDSTWENVDLPVLDAAVRHLDEHMEARPKGSTLAELTGLPLADVKRALARLNGEYIHVATTSGDGAAWRVSQVYPSARRAVGQWPSPESVADRLVAALAAAAERADTDEERGMLRKTAAWFGDAGRDLLVEVTAAVVARSTGMSGT